MSDKTNPSVLLQQLRNLFHVFDRQLHVPSAQISQSTFYVPAAYVIDSEYQERDGHHEFMRDREADDTIPKGTKPLSRSSIKPFRSAVIDRAPKNLEACPTFLWQVGESAREMGGVKENIHHLGIR